VTDLPARATQPLRVVLLDSITEWGGGEKWCVDTARELAARGHRVVIACARGSALEGHAAREHVELWSASLRGDAGLRAAVQLGSWMRREHMEIVVANVGRDVRIGALACLQSGAVLVQRRGIARPMKRDPLSRYLYTRVVRRVVANCEAIRERMLEGADFVAPERVVVIGNGVDLARMPRGDGAGLRAELAIRADRPLAAIVGRLSQMKGHADLLEAWKSVVRALPDAVLLVVGDGDERRAIEERVREAGLESSVRLLGFRDDVADILAAADVLALPSTRDEGCNNTLLEALAIGTACVVTRCGGLPELIDDGVTGLVVEIGDRDALADAITRILSRPAFRDALRSAARARSAERQSLAAVTAQWESLLAGVVHGE
jgi:glycosyltransferase involved in cell wall biosynthesis